jgi:hypothetical protein
MIIWTHAHRPSVGMLYLSSVALAELDVAGEIHREVVV